MAVKFVNNALKTAKKMLADCFRLKKSELRRAHIIPRPVINESRDMRDIPHLVIVTIIMCGLFHSRMQMG